MVRMTVAVRVITVVIVFVVRMGMHNVDLFLMWIRVDKDKQPARRTSFGSLAVLQAPKSASFTQLTRLHTPKRDVFGKAVYQSLLIYVVYRIHSME